MDTYIATDTRNGRFYIGSTTNFEWRKYCHLNSRRNYPFQNALRKHPEAFTWEVISDDSEGAELEQALLDMFFGTEQCYNLNPVAGRPPSQAGKPVSQETRQKQSASQKARVRTPEEIEKFRKMASERSTWRTNPPKSPTQQPGPGNPNNKPVEVVYPDGEVKVFYSVEAASKLLGVAGPNIAEAARKNKTKTKGKLKGYSFRYL